MTVTNKSDIIETVKRGKVLTPRKEENKMKIMEDLEMTEKEQATMMIDVYTDLQRIHKADDRRRVK